MSARKNYVIWGSSGHAKVLTSLLKLQGDQVVAYFDNDPHATTASPNVPLFIGTPGFATWRQQNGPGTEIYGLVAIGGDRGPERLAHQQFLAQQGLLISTLVHPQAAVCPTARLGMGTQILAQAVVAADVTIGTACIINHGVTLDHECSLGDGVHLAPHATLCGCVTVGDHTLIGAGAVILPRRRIGAHTLVGAGAVVTRDLPAHVVAVGNPAKIIRVLNT